MRKGEIIILLIDGDRIKGWTFCDINRALGLGGV